MKMYSKRILTSALALGLCIGMTACGEDKIADETTAETTAVTTTTPETTSETTVETTAPETEEEKIGINQDLVSEYGLTFAEIKAKHGNIIDIATPYGGWFFKFETGYGWYSFYGDYDYDNQNWKPIEGTDKSAPLPKDNYICIWIDGIDITDFLVGDFDTISVKELENIDGMHLDSNGESYMDFSDKYVATFSYDEFSHEKTGFTGDKTGVYINHKKEDVIDHDSFVNIQLWASFADKYLGTTANEKQPTDAG